MVKISIVSRMIQSRDDSSDPPTWWYVIVWDYVAELNGRVVQGVANSERGAHRAIRRAMWRTRRTRSTTGAY